MNRSPNPISLIAFAWIGFILAVLLAAARPADAATGAAGTLLTAPTAASEIPAGPAAVSAEEAEAADPAPGFDPAEIRAPYDEFVLTQGIHNIEFGYAAVDLAAGKGAAVLSPISGLVTDHFVDEYGNTTLLIENDVYLVTLLHGNYSVDPGDEVAIGQVIGEEWNNGYTLDGRGNLCAGRDCGYHTHLNIYDKRIGDNANPIDLLGLHW